MQAIGYINTINSSDLGIGSLDTNRYFKDITDLLSRRFKEVVRVNSLQEAASSGADISAILDVYAKLGSISFTHSIFQDKLIFMSLDGAQIDVASGEGRAMVPYPAWPTHKQKAADAAMIELEKSLSSSEKLKEYARTYSGNRSATIAITAPAKIKSDVDELPAIKAKPNKKAYAIVIGIENYRQKLPRADFATHDAETVAEYLTKVMGYPAENVVTLLNDHASNVDFAKYFEKWLPNNVEKDSTVFIYYSGHGAPNTKTGDAFLVPYDGDPSFINETGYSLKRLYDSLGKLQAKEIIVALDSCFSGAGGRSVIAKGSRPLVMRMDNLTIPSKIAVLSASSGEQTSSTYEEKGHGLFTYFLLKGIKDDDNANKNGTVEIGELFDYIKPQVERIARKVYNNEQTPQMTAPKENQKIFLISNGK
ncbi:MAG: caspase family protein [Deltaproteobacteria bacterium]|nr:caspase family protein [Deltaproteobacteria bacterium]